MPYVTVDRLKVGHDDATDTPQFREPGEPIPEAEGWPWQLRDSYLKARRIIEVETLPATPKKEDPHHAKR